MHQVINNNKLQHKYPLTPLDPRLLYIGPIQAKGHLSFGDAYPVFLQLPACTMCTISSCMWCCRALVCTMQCWAASNAHYAVLGSFQRALLSFLHSIHHICTILQLFLSKLYSITIYLGYWTILNIYILKALKYYNFLNIYI